MKSDWTENAAKVSTCLPKKFEPNITSAIHNVQLLAEIGHSAETRCQWLEKLGGTPGAAKQSGAVEHASLSNYLGVVASIFLFADTTRETRAALNILQKITKVKILGGSPYAKKTRSFWKIFSFEAF